MSPIFHSLRVRSVQPDTQEAVIVAFDVPEVLRPIFGFTQGQYLTLRKEIDGQDLRRSYSICAGVDDGELRVGVRKVRGGVFSNWINENLRPGDTICVFRRIVTGGFGIVTEVWGRVIHSLVSAYRDRPFRQRDRRFRYRDRPFRPS